MPLSAAKPQSVPQATAGTINDAAQHERQSPFRVGLSERFKGEITPDKEEAEIKNCLILQV